MRVASGDLFRTQTGAIGHGVNCRGAMGAGIATIFKRRYPEMYLEYRRLCQEGSLQGGGFFPWKLPNGSWVYNLASQEAPGPHASLEWLTEAAEKALAHADAHGIEEISLPQIGCGIGGLTWEEVAPALEDLEEGHRASFVVYVLPGA